jgi:hypothetical protein
MFKWSKFRATLLAASVVLAATQFGGFGCGLGNLNLSHVMELVAIGSIFD